MTTFATPIPAGSAQHVALSSAVPTDPALRFAGDLIQWVGVQAGTAITAFATGCVARASGPTNGYSGPIGAGLDGLPTFAVAADGPGRV